MGAPKQKWTSQEESALKAGIAKHGAGKWSTILKDPEFSQILFSRSNVDLKDKWRNICVIPTGRGPRDKTPVPMKKSRHVPKNNDSNQMALSTAGDDSSDGIVDARPLAMVAEPLPITAPKRAEAKLATLILEAITRLKEPTGSNKTAIAMYIEDNYLSPPDFKQALSGELKKMIETGLLVKVRHNYRIAPSSNPLKGRSSKVLREVRQKEPSTVDRDDIKNLHKTEIDAELARMEFMTSEEAAAAAAQAIADAELAMAEAEEAMRLAEAAEAEAEAAQAFAEAASLTLRNRCNMMMVPV